jgi:hypothetical protein
MRGSSLLRFCFREPLVHFLLLGVALFFIHGYVRSDEVAVDSRTIVVNREKLLAYVQYRSRTFEATRFDTLIDSLSERELKDLIRDYVREEALYREAKALQLDSGDYVARLRLVQQLEFITRGIASEQIEVTDREIRTYYDTHDERYRVPPKVTFTHVFLGISKQGESDARGRALAELERLNRAQVGFIEAASHGERFPHGLNYIERSPEEIASHFGEPMQRALFALEADDRLWRGPFRSEHGYHLVLLTRRLQGHKRPLAEVSAKVEQAVREAVLADRFEKSVREIVSAYDVRVESVQRPVRRASNGPAP